MRVHRVACIVADATAIVRLGRGEIFGVSKWLGKESVSVRLDGLPFQSSDGTGTKVGPIQWDTAGRWALFLAIQEMVVVMLVVVNTNAERRAWRALDGSTGGG